jgi:hypothetical protein
MIATLSPDVCASLVGNRLAQPFMFRVAFCCPTTRKMCQNRCPDAFHYLDLNCVHYVWDSGLSFRFTSAHSRKAFNWEQKTPVRCDSKSYAFLA